MRCGILLSAVVLASCNAVKAPADEPDDRPSAKDSNFQAAATECGVEEWQREKAVTFDGPQIEAEFFSYELESLANEEIEDKIPGRRTWDRTERIGVMDECLKASFEQQGVKAYLASPLPRETVTERAEPSMEAAN